ncbi:MAG: tetratricopeptide repeat protein [Hyphomicrobiaceae bacterium]
MFARPISAGLRLGCAILWIALGISAAHARVATDCFSQDFQRRIDGCTAIIESPATTPADKADAYSRRALAYSLRGQYGSAIQDYDAAIQIDPNFSVALNNRAWAYFKWGRAAEGLPDVERSLQINPGSEHTWDTRAHIRHSMGDAAGAFEDYQRAMTIGGAKMIRIYQCGLSSSGRYRGRLDGIYSDELRDAIKACASSRTCDPLPEDEECRDPMS